MWIASLAIYYYLKCLILMQYCTRCMSNIEFSYQLNHCNWKTANPLHVYLSLSVYVCIGMYSLETVKSLEEPLCCINGSITININIKIIMLVVSILAAKCVQTHKTCTKIEYSMKFWITVSQMEQLIFQVSIASNIQPSKHPL